MGKKISGKKISVGIIGASGYVGAELMRLLHGHDSFDVGFITGDSQAEVSVAQVYPNLVAAVSNKRFATYNPQLVDEVELVFLALPHGESMSLAKELLDQEKLVVDLAADFRLNDSAQYLSWYGEPHFAPEVCEDFVYGLPELFRQDLVGDGQVACSAVAVPGCYPTAAALVLAPLVRMGLIQTDGVIVDAASGVSGAGRSPKAHTTFCGVDEDFTAYGLLNHRHTPEIEQACGVSVLFTPHLAPMSRGILATCYAKPAASISGEALLGTSSEAWLGALADFYANEPFVVVSERVPSTKATLGCNMAHLTVRFDERTQTVLALCAIDNLMKGAAGQAVQCANLICGLDETVGLPRVGVFP
ncbi:MAG: N-acetyl-gamma-glutamyl-phosphate reductase [Acidimicrobiia bacterium]|nr:N-acetyl-gamma-glutamyl-phosphate reductase [Acidimicrobiia bacterium]MYC57466.1 N-acetyl-gamma-glutamyl-phosphate reductase [Acidimicrobiia bacterium]MYI30046.1 N-acetyl-gamma-glutamyl-phosphate reductase [Acidimicrobiia bacterium]